MRGEAKADRKLCEMISCEGERERKEQYAMILIRRAWPAADNKDGLSVRPCGKRDEDE